MAPLGRGGQPGPRTVYHVNQYFGSLEAMKNQFILAAVNVEASGWCILTWQPSWGRLEILQAEKHQNLTEWSGFPFLYAMYGSMHITWTTRTGGRTM